ncbi:molybdopterin molybdotransferase MoeA [Fuchsiella alkaliacetigena]|uniref:molybdopterin molybdotransferase MoeA n=1 Tax=Fuchsiella alkaliacetigena TaxID=957042 RepID=UPI00200B9112|nr:gephyrin-like molybdotransferase Glp [Fuchsiella alkaliacetigena]MCK8824404.1 molybdopterin molybdotransferase MoeA [Fuchsiella alkaliacetigena]
MAFFELITPLKAREIIKSNIKSLQKTEGIKVTEALGRVTAEDILASEDLPAFTKSVMDGYALRAEDSFGASEEKPKTLELVGEVEMGAEPKVTVESGQAVKIPTGGMLPAGAEGVIMIEETALKGDKLTIYNSISPGENIVAQGSDIETGQVVLASEHRLRAQDIGMLAGLGIAEVSVYRRPKVGVISTGNELISLNEERHLGQTRDINTYSLCSLVEELGAIAVPGGIIEDNEESLKEAVINLVDQVDFIVVSGGSSVGVKDVTYTVLNELGDSEVLIHGIAIKPGKPTIFNLVEGVPAYGLPGHPVSAMVVFKKFVAPYIEAVMGGEQEKRHIEAEFSQNLSSDPGREDYIRVKLKKEATGWVAKPVQGESSLMMTMVAADGLVKVPWSKEGLAAGEVVRVELF